MLLFQEHTRAWRNLVVRYVLLVHTPRLIRFVLFGMFCLAHTLCSGEAATRSAVQQNTADATLSGEVCGRGVPKGFGLRFPKQENMFALLLIAHAERLQGDARLRA